MYTIVRLDDMGADPLGVANSNNAFDAAVASILPGEGIILGTPGAVYRLKDNWEINGADNLTIDLQGATIHSLSRRTVQLTGCSQTRFCNFKFGNDDDNFFNGISLLSCVDCIVESGEKQGLTGTGFTMSLCEDCQFIDIANTGGSPIIGAIGFLIHMGINCKAVRCQALVGPFSYGFQVKGGTNNQVVDSVVDAECQIGFRDRGDAPGTSSATADKDIPYPFPDGSWDEPDERRRSQDTVFQVCRANVPGGNAFVCQEAVRTKILDATVTDATYGAVLLRTGVDGGEQDYLLSNFDFGGIPVYARSTGSERLPGVRIENGADGSVIILERTESAAIHNVSGSIEETDTIDTVITESSGPDQYDPGSELSLADSATSSVETPSPPVGMGEVGCYCRTGTMFEISAPYPGLQTTSLLPNPEFSDTESLTDVVVSKRATDGTLYTYVKTKGGRRKMQWSFRLTRNKGLEVRAFLLSYFASRIRVVDHNDRIWVGNFTNNPFEFVTDRKAGPAIQGWPKGETQTITLEFEGVEQ